MHNKVVFVSLRCEQLQRRRVDAGAILVRSNVAFVVGVFVLYGRINRMEIAQGLLAKIAAPSATREVEQVHQRVEP